MTVVDLCKMAGHALYFKFCEIISNRIKVFYTENFKGNNSAKNVGGVTVVDLCTSSGHALYFY